jgi:hypothetical protein
VNQLGCGEPAFSPSGLDEKPVDYWPGSPEKINVIARRLDAGLELWHPQDRHCLDRHTHTQMFRDLSRDVEMGDERERTVWVELDAVIVMLTDSMVTVRKRRATTHGYKQIRLQRDHVARYRYLEIGERLDPLNGVPLAGILIPRWLAEARNLMEI